MHNQIIVTEILMLPNNSEMRQYFVNNGFL